MARALVLAWEDEVSELPLARIDRAKLYGTRRRVVADEEGNPCTAAWLSADGRTLVAAGGYAMGHVDEAGTSIARDELVTIDADGDVLDKLPSTLGVRHELYGPVPAARVLDFVTDKVYLLTPDAIGPRLSAALDRGEIFEAEFRYTASPHTDTLFLLRNDAGTFGLVSRPIELTFVGRHSPEPDELDDEDDADADDLDFSF